MGRAEEELGVHALIAAQRRLMESKHPFEQVVGTLWVAGTLKRRLAQLSDRQIGQLLWDHVLDELTLFGPGAAICEHAVRRLLRSEGGSWTANDKSVMDEDTFHIEFPNSHVSSPGLRTEALVNEALGHRKAYAAIAACDERNPSF